MNKGSQEIATVSTKAKYGRKKLSTTKRITYLATLVAAALALKLAGQALTFGSLKITLTYIPWIIAGIVMGPLGGATVAFATDLVGTLILPSALGLPMPLISLSNALFGFIMGLAFKIPKLDDRIKLVIGTVLVLSCCTLGLTTYQLARTYGVTYWQEFLVRLPQAFMVVLCATATAFLFPLLKKLQLMQ